MENFSALPKAYINLTTPSRQYHAVFHYFLSDYSKHDATTITAHRKRFISLLKEKTLLTTFFSTVWVKTDGCAEQYICDSALYLMSDMSQCYSVIIDRVISSPGSGKEMLDGHNAIDEHYIYIYIN